MKIKKFNESNYIGDEIYCVIIRYPDNMGFGYRSSIKAFSSELKAANYVIEFCNDSHQTDYEKFIDEDGSRFFVNIDDNEDYGNCISCLEEDDTTVEIVKLKLE